MLVDQSLKAFHRPEIAHRAEIMLGGVALAGGAVLALSALAKGPSARNLIVPAAESSFVYLVLGVVTRSVIQHHQSRTQIAVLAGVVGAVEAVRPSRSGEPRVATWLVGSLAASVGVAMAKWALEPGGIPTATEP